VTAPLVVLIVLAGAARDPADDTLIAAARDALGQDAIVLVDAAPAAAERDDAGALGLGARVRARAVVRVVWDEGKTTARLDVHVDPSVEWAHDEIHFQVADALTERGRTAGFALASMVQRLEAAHEPPPPAPAPPKPPPPNPPQTVDALAIPPARPTRATPSPVDAFAVGAAAIAGAATGFGGSAGVRWFPTQRLGVRAAIGARFGSIDVAAARDNELIGGAGLVVRLARAGDFVFELRGDALLLREEVTRSYTTGNVSLSRWLAGADGAAEVSYWVSPRAAIVAAGGAEVAFGPTDVNVGGEARAQIPVARALAELGLRVGF
jgi:hypothetical protein